MIDIGNGPDLEAMASGGGNKHDRRLNVVTDEMVDAGWLVATAFDLDISNPKRFFTAVFEAMVSAKGGARR